MVECGECTLCCELPYIKELNKPTYTLCSFCDNGCTIHDNKPKECSDFKCAYLQMKKVSVKMRPDNCGVIFEKLNNDLMLGTINPKHENLSFVKGQISYFLKEGINVVLSKQGVPIVYHLDDVSPELLLKRIYNIKQNNGSSNI